MTHCKNCGTDFEGNFCPECGQSAKVKRLTFKSVFVEATWDILSMDSGMFYTMWQLLRRPWKVISEYIRGRRASYTKPVQLLLVTFVLLALVKSIPGLGTIEGNLSGGLDMETSHAGAVGALWDWIARFVVDSKMTQVVISSLIAAIACWLVYLPFGSRRFNLVEYCCAFFYVESMSNIITIVCSPLNLISQNLFDVVSGCWTAILSVIIVFRAFPIRRRWLRVTMLCVCGLVLFIIAVLLVSFVISVDTLLPKLI